MILFLFTIAVIIISYSLNVFFSNESEHDNQLDCDNEVSPCSMRSVHVEERTIFHLKFDSLDISYALNNGD